MTTPTIRQWTPGEVARHEAEEAARARAFDERAVAHAKKHSLDSRLKKLTDRLRYIELAFPEHHKLYALEIMVDYMKKELGAQEQAEIRAAWKSGSR